jgi:hypothetical protein
MFISRSKQIELDLTKNLEVVGAVTGLLDFNTNDTSTFMIQRGNTMAYVDFP